MRNVIFRRFISPSSRSNSSLPSLLSSRRNAVAAPLVEDEGDSVVFPREGPGISYGLNWALAGKGVIVKDKAFRNLKSSELQQKGATLAESLSGLPVHVRGNVLGGATEITKAQFGKLLKQVTSHLSSIPDLIVHDGTIGASSKCDTKVRVISDSSSAVLSLSNILWNTSARAVSHDSSPLTVYVATSVSPNAGDIAGLGAKGTSGFIAADIERSSLILCGKAFSDINGVKEALAALSEPVLSARGGLPLSARLLVSGDSVVLLFATQETIRTCSDILVSAESGIVLSSHGVAPLFKTGNSNVFKLPAAVILASSDSSGVIPPISKLSPGQAAYHFLAGYQNGKFVPGYSKSPSSIAPVELAKDLLSKLKDNQIPSFLVNVNEGVTGKDLMKLMQSALSNKAPAFESKDANLVEKYNSFLLGKFKELPDEFSF